MQVIKEFGKAITEGIKRIRKERHITQEEFAKLLGLSQQQFSVIERGNGSISAEQFVLILNHFNLSIDYFIKREASENEDSLLQNALSRLGANHLKEIPGIFLPDKYTHLNEVIFETLNSTRSSRLITACAVVIVKNIQQINFNLIERKLSDVGRQNRLWWVLESALQSIQSLLKEEFLLRDLKLSYRRAEKILNTHILHKTHMAPKATSFSQSNEDILDTGINSIKTLDSLKLNLDPLAKKWNIITSIKQSDFNEMFRNTELP